MGKKHAIQKFREQRILEAPRYLGLHVKVEEYEAGQYRIYERESIDDEWVATESGQRREITRLAFRRAEDWKRAQ